jgi:hypothetical protein
MFYFWKLWLENWTGGSRCRLISGFSFIIFYLSDKFGTGAGRPARAKFVDFGHAREKFVFDARAILEKLWIMFGLVDI